MVSWTEYKSMAMERGSLALELYVVISTPVKAGDAVKAVLPDHLNYQAAQEAGGNLAFAGPLSDLSGESMEGAGLIIYRAASFDEARSIAENDPMHQTKTREFTIQRWLVNEGSFNLKVGLSAQQVIFS